MKMQQDPCVQLYGGAHCATVRVDDQGFANSEKRVPGSRLVTRTGTLTGTRELRRSTAGEFAFCIVTAFVRG